MSDSDISDDKGVERSRGAHVDDHLVASAVFVPTASGVGMSAGPGSPELAVVLGSPGPITPDVGIFPVVRLEMRAFRRPFERGSISHQVVESVTQHHINCLPIYLE